MKKQRRITKCYFDLFLSKFKNMLTKICVIECGKDWEEYLSITYQELMYVMIYFDQHTYPQINDGSFSSYLFRRVSGRLKHALSKTLRYRRIELIENSQIDNENFCDKDNDLPILIEELMNKLTQKEYDVIKSYFLERKTLMETANVIGMSLGTVVKLKIKAIGKMSKLKVI